MVYMAESVSLAVLENLVHMTRVDFPAGYIVVTATIPDRVRILTDADVASRFGALGEKQIGDRWIDSLASAVLQVRSAVVSLEHIYLLNPSHPDFSAIKVGKPVPFLFDDRLLRPRQ